MFGYILALIIGGYIGWYICKREREEEFWTEIENEASDMNDLK